MKIFSFILAIVTTRDLSVIRFCLYLSFYFSFNIFIIELLFIKYYLLRIFVDGE